MPDIRTYGDEFPLDEALCRNCAFRMSIVVEPLDPETFGIDEDMLLDMNLDEDEGLIVEQHICLVSQQEMDYIVKSCNHFKSCAELSIFKTDILR